MFGMKFNDYILVNVESHVELVPTNCVDSYQQRCVLDQYIK